MKRFVLNYNIHCYITVQQNFIHICIASNYIHLYKFVFNDIYTNIDGFCTQVHIIV